LRAARRYAGEVKDKEKQFVLHATTFLGEQERWVEFYKPLKNSNGEILREDVSIEDFMIDGSPDYKAYERAKRGYEPYTPGQGRQRTT